MPSESAQLALHAALSVGLPALIAFGIAVATRRSGGAGTAAGLALACLVSWVMERGGLDVPGGERWHLVGPAIIALGALAPWLGVLQRRMPPFLATVLLSGAAGVVVGRWVHFLAWTPYHGIAMGTSIGLGGLLVEWCAARRHGAAVPLSLAIACFAEAGLLVLSGFFTLATPAAALGLSLAAIAFALRDTAAARDDGSARTIAGGGALTAFAAIALLAFAGWTYDYTPIDGWMWLLPLALPLVLLVAEVPALARRAQRSALGPLLFRAVPALLLCSLALGAAWRAIEYAPPPEAGGADDFDPFADLLRQSPEGR